MERIIIISRTIIVLTKILTPKVSVSLAGCKANS